MNKYEFVLRFKLPEDNGDPESFLDALYENGCDDAVIGTGLSGCIGLDFYREANTAIDAVKTAVHDVKTAIPNVQLIEVAPDLLNTTELADLISSRIKKITRQAMRKYTQNHVEKVISRFPIAAITSTSPLWHADEVTEWLINNEKASGPEAEILIETSKAARLFNHKLQAHKLANDLTPLESISF